MELAGFYDQIRLDIGLVRRRSGGHKPESPGGSAPLRWSYALSKRSATEGGGFQKEREDRAKNRQGIQARVQQNCTSTQYWCSGPIRFRNELGIPEWSKTG